MYWPHSTSCWPSQSHAYARGQYFGRPEGGRHATSCLQNREIQVARGRRQDEGLVFTVAVAVNSLVSSGVPPLAAAPAPTSFASMVPGSAVTTTSPATTSTPAPVQPVETSNGNLMYNVSINQPFDMVPNFFTNLAEKMTGNRDARHGMALAHLSLAGERLVSAALKSAAQGSGVVAAGSSFLAKAIPFVNFGVGGYGMWRGWNELADHKDGIFGLVGSKTARTGMLTAAAGAALLIPGIPGLVTSAAMFAMSAANDLDVFKKFDKPLKEGVKPGNLTGISLGILDGTPSPQLNPDTYFANTGQQSTNPATANGIPQSSGGGGFAARATQFIEAS